MRELADVPAELQDPCLSLSAESVTSRHARTQRPTSHGKSDFGKNWLLCVVDSQLESKACLFLPWLAGITKEA